MLIATLPPVSNRADWIDVAEFTDEQTGELVKIDDCRIVMTLRDENDCQATSATTDDGTVQFISIGVAQFTFSRAVMSSLQPGAYQVGATISRDDQTTQYLIGTVPIVDGVVRR